MNMRTVISQLRRGTLPMKQLKDFFKQEQAKHFWTFCELDGVKRANLIAEIVVETAKYEDTYVFDCIVGGEDEYEEFLAGRGMFEEDDYEITEFGRLTRVRRSVETIV